MNTPIKIFGCLMVAVLCTSVSVAEVGVAVRNPGSPNPSVSGLYLNGITEEGNPITLMWRKLSSSPSLMVLNEQGELNGDGRPSLLRNSVSGLPMVAWARNAGTHFDVVVSHYISGVWTIPQVVAGSADDELDPHLVLAPNGDVHLFYWVNSGTSQIVMHTQAPPDLSSWAAPDQVSGVGESACRPAGVFHDGVLHATYEVHYSGFNGTPRNVILARQVGVSFLPEILAVTSNPDEVRPQVHSANGRIWVEWIDATGPGEFDGEMAWTRQDGLEQWEPTLYESVTSEEERDYHVRGSIRSQAIH